MEKIKLWFPIVYHGILFHTTKYGRNSLLNILFWDIEDPIEGGVNDGDAGRLIKGTPRSDLDKNGNGPVYVHKKQEFARDLEDDDRYSRLKKLDIPSVDIVVSAFHAFISEQADISDYDLNKLNEVIESTRDAYRYIAKLLEMTITVDYTGSEEARRQVAEYQDVLHALKDRKDIVNLFSGEALSPRVRADLSKTFTPFFVEILKSDLVTRYPGLLNNPEAEKQFQEGGFYSLQQYLGEAGIISPYEMKKSFNRLKITEMAHNSIEENATEDNLVCQKPDNDWVRKFFDLAGEISDEDLQTYWAKLLAGEIQSPSSVARRTLDTFTKMTKEEIDRFKDIRNFVLITDGVDPKAVVYPNAIKEHVDAALAECGLLSSVESESIVFKTNDNIGEWYAPILTDRNGYSVVLYPPKEDVEKTQKLSREFKVRYVTKVGMELFHVIDKPRRSNKFTVHLCQVCHFFALDGWDARIYRILHGKGPQGRDLIDKSRDIYQEFLQYVHGKMPLEHQEGTLYDVLPLSFDLYMEEPQLI